MSQPPFDFGLPFSPSAHINNLKGTETPIFVATPTPIATQAARLYGRELSRAGYSTNRAVRLPGANGLAVYVTWWPSYCEASPEQLAELAQRVAAIPEEEERARQARAAAVAEANAAYAARGRSAAPRLAEIVRSSPWMLGRLAGEAAQILENPLTDSAASRVVALLATADRAVANAEARLRRLAPRDWRALAADPAVRQAALEGCVLLSSLDVDRATKRNGIGWGADDTGVGHVLASRASLTESEAAHALALLSVHRRQLPPALLARLAGGAPAAAPAQAALAL
ncbi:hypothetical protein [Methylobacterium aquaticum]|uniref:hypothetical protein n=1 Tax=Methylobacterium aquaticum TaxID=270351 RepID=UPI0019326C9B|nr:hypothetical protein [Methylobacterium aquaticum]QRE76840.1 hypothetical protein F1D61_27755 [Methylobacterium aquaticum]